VVGWSLVPCQTADAAVRVAAEASLTASGSLSVHGRVRQSRPGWRAKLQTRTSRTRSGRVVVRWSKVGRAHRLRRGGRFRFRATIGGPTAVIRIVVTSGRHVIARSKAITVAPPGSTPGPEPDPATLITGTPPASPPPASTLTAGERLATGEALISPNRRYRLVMQGDGNLVLYEGGKALWYTGTQGNGVSAVMQADGNLVVYRAGVALWSSGTNGFDGGFFTLQDDGNTVIYQLGHPVWSRFTGYIGDRLQSGWRLQPGAYLLSPNHAYRLIMQGDGNLVLYAGDTALWSSITQGDGSYAVMQGDGNFVVYRGVVAGWWSGTTGHPGAFVVAQDDSNLVVYEGSTALWWRLQGSTTATPGPEWLPFVGSYGNALSCTWNNGCGGGYHGYAAIDFSIPNGTRLIAAGDGSISAVQRGCGAAYPCGLEYLGNSVRIRHDDGRYSVYGHMSTIPASIQVGVRVAAGDLIGYSGNSSSGAFHLHYEERSGPGWNTKLDPGPMKARHGAATISYPGALGSSTWFGGSAPNCGRQPGEPGCQGNHTLRNDGP
jgi:hypothetical protein